MIHILPQKQGSSGLKFSNLTAPIDHLNLGHLAAFLSVPLNCEIWSHITVHRRVGRWNIYAAAAARLLLLSFHGSRWVIDLGNDETRQVIWLRHDVTPPANYCRAVTVADQIMRWKVAIVYSPIDEILQYRRWMGQTPAISTTTSGSILGYRRLATSSGTADWNAIPCLRGGRQRDSCVGAQYITCQWHASRCWRSWSLAGRWSDCYCIVTATSFARPLGDWISDKI